MAEIENESVTISHSLKNGTCGGYHYCGRGEEDVGIEISLYRLCRKQLAGLSQIGAPIDADDFAIEIGKEAQIAGGIAKI